MASSKISDAELLGVWVTSQMKRLKQKHTPSRQAAEDANDGNWKEVKITNYLRPHKYHRLMSGQLKKKLRDCRTHKSQVEALGEERIDNGSAILMRYGKLCWRQSQSIITHSSSHS